MNAIMLLTFFAFIHSFIHLFVTNVFEIICVKKYCYFSSILSTIFYADAKKWIVDRYASETCIKKPSAHLRWTYCCIFEKFFFWQECIIALLPFKIVLIDKSFVNLVLLNILNNTFYIKKYHWSSSYITLICIIYVKFSVQLVWTLMLAIGMP